jgi:hypothetical protein
VQKVAFFCSLHLGDLALAHACALGSEAAWDRFLALFRGALVNAAISITGSATLGRDLAGSLTRRALRTTSYRRRAPVSAGLLLRPRFAHELAPNHARPAVPRPPSPHRSRRPSRGC